LVLLLQAPARRRLHAANRVRKTQAQLGFKVTLGSE